MTRTASGLHAGYVDVRWGQVHYRQAGTSGPWVLLFHESPLSGRVFEAVLPRLAAHVRAVAFDTPGYGASTPPPRDGFEIPEYAQVLAEAANQLGVDRPFLAGVHTGASLALEVGRHVAGGPAGFVLSGVPVFTAAEREEYLAGWTPRPPFDNDGAQFAWAVQRYRRIWGADVPAPMLHRAVLDLAGVLDRYAWAYQAAFRHDPAPTLAAATAPVLLLNAENDLLAEQDVRASRLARDVRLVQFEGLPGQPHQRAPERYARELLDFVHEHSTGSGS